MNKPTMIKMLELSGGAYSDLQPVCKTMKVELIENKTTDTECFARIIGNNVIIAFRGTDSKTN